MGYDPSAPKRPVNMSLNEDLIRQAREVIPNLSVTVETLLADHVQRLQDSASLRKQQIAGVIAAENAFVSEFGSFADEYNVL